MDRSSTKAARVVHYLAITKARINLGQVVRRVTRNKEYFILEKDGIPVAGIMGADELEDYLELSDTKIRADILSSSAEYRAGRGRPAQQFLEELDREQRRTKTARRKRA
jgi:antitoxin (DNA-binding transcriptional repressor) of toxin-antitoxin stability system